MVRLLNNICITKPQWVNTLRQNSCHFAEDIFKWISLFQISLFWFQFHFYWFPGHQLTDNESALVQVMALAPNRRLATIWTDEPVYWHIWVFSPQWVNYSTPHTTCTWFCCALFCWAYIISVHRGFVWSIYPYPSELLRWHWDSHMISPVQVK